MGVTVRCQSGMELSLIRVRLGCLLWVWKRVNASLWHMRTKEGCMVY